MHEKVALSARGTNETHPLLILLKATMALQPLPSFRPAEASRGPSTTDVNGPQSLWRSSPSLRISEESGDLSQHLQARFGILGGPFRRVLLGLGNLRLSACQLTVCRPFSGYGLRLRYLRDTASVTPMPLHLLPSHGQPHSLPSCSAAGVCFWSVLIQRLPLLLSACCCFPSSNISSEINCRVTFQSKPFATGQKENTYQWLA